MNAEEVKGCQPSLKTLIFISNISLQYAKSYVNKSQMEM